VPPLGSHDDEEPFKFTKTVCLSLPYKNMESNHI